MAEGGGLSPLLSTGESAPGVPCLSVLPSAREAWTWWRESNKGPPR